VAEEAGWIAAECRRRGSDVPVPNGVWRRSRCGRELNGLTYWAPTRIGSGAGADSALAPARLVGALAGRGGGRLVSASIPLGLTGSHALREFAIRSFRTVGADDEPDGHNGDCSTTGGAERRTNDHSPHK